MYLVIYQPMGMVCGTFLKYNDGPFLTKEQLALVLEENKPQEFTVYDVGEPKVVGVKHTVEIVGD